MPKSFFYFFRSLPRPPPPPQAFEDILPYEQFSLRLTNEDLPQVRTQAAAAAAAAAAATALQQCKQP